MTGYETDIVFVAFTAVDPGDQGAISQNWSGDVVIAEGRIRHRRFPNQKAGARIDGPDAGILGCCINHVAEDSDVFLHAAANSCECRRRHGGSAKLVGAESHGVRAFHRRSDAGAIFPYQVPIGCIQGLDYAPGSG